MKMNRYHFPFLVLASICNRHVSGQTSQMVEICQTIQTQYTGGVSVSTPNYPNYDTNTAASCQCLITWSSSGSNVTLSYTTWNFDAYTTSCWGWLDYQYDVSSSKTKCLSIVPSNPILSQYTTYALLLRYSRQKTIFDKTGKFLLTVNVSPPSTIILVNSAPGSNMVYPVSVPTSIPPGQPGSSNAIPPESTNAPMPSTQFQSANPSNNPASTPPTTIPYQPASGQPPQPSLPQPSSTTTQSNRLTHSSSQNGSSTTTTSSNITSNNISSIIPDPLSTNDDETANGLATSSIIGIAVGVGGFFIIATIVVIVVACLMFRRSQKKEKEKVELQEMKNASIRSRPAVALPVSDPEGIRTENEYQVDGGYMEIQDAQKKPVPGPGDIVFTPPENGNDVNGKGLYYRICDMTSAKIPRSSGDVPNNNNDSGSTDNASNDVIYVTPGNSTSSAQQENARNESSGPKLKLTGMSSVRIC